VDDRQFDTLVRSLAAGTSRRTGIRLLAGAGAALVALARGSDSGVLARRGTAGPGDPCRHDDQCLGADAPLVCAWNGFDYDGELNCCTYEGGRCGFDEACCGLASCVGGFCSGGGFASAGSGGFASANAQGGTVSIGDINSGGNVGNTISVGNTRGSVRVSGGTVSNTTDISVSADGGTAIADASGGDYNVSGTGDGSGGDGGGPTYAGPGDPCWSGVQCVAADTALTCDYNNSTDDYRCCAYEGDRCGWDGGCCGWLSCNDNGFCTSQSWSWSCTGQGCACQLYRDPECRASCPLYDPCDAGLVCTGTSDVTGTCVPSQSSGCTWEGCACYRGWNDADPCDQGLVCCLNGSPVMGGSGGCVPQWQC
jgi:hypothetical protein